MSTKEIIAAIFELPHDERQYLIGEVLHRMPEMEPPTTAALIAELDRRHQEILDNPDDGYTWEEVCAELDQRRKDRRKRNGK